MTLFRQIRAAVMFLTRLPVGNVAYRASDFAWAPAHFPLVGAGLGLVAAGVARALAPLGAASAALFAIAALTIVTGALHEDGFADTCDAFGGASDRDKVLAILKDSRIGTFGAVAVVLSIAGRAALLAPLETRCLGALVMAGAAARAGPVWLMATLRYAGQAAESKSRDMRAAGVRQAAVATLWLGVIAALTIVTGAASWPRVVATVVACALVTSASGTYFVRRLGGITGDFLGATEQLGEMAALAVFAWGNTPS